jgi:hypothetical protein
MPTAPLPVLPPPAAISPPASPSSVLGSAGGASTPNFLATAFAGTNNDLRFSQVDGGSAPTIRFLMDNVGSDSVTVTGRAILVHLRQNLGAYYLTSAAIKTLIEASAPAMALITVTHAAGNDGSGAICQPNTTDISFGPTALAGGNYPASPPAVIAAPGGTPTAPSPVI